MVMQVISGHLGWVRSVAFDPSNNWFCTGSADRTIKVFNCVIGTYPFSLSFFPSASMRVYKMDIYLKIQSLLFENDFCLFVVLFLAC